MTLMLGRDGRVTRDSVTPASAWRRYISSVKTGFVSISFMGPGIFLLIHLNVYSWLVSQALIYHQISDIRYYSFNIQYWYPLSILWPQQRTAPSLCTCWRIIRLWLYNFTHHSLWVWNIAAGVSDKCFPRRDYPFIHYWYPRISRSRDSRFYLESHHAHASHHRIWREEGKG